MSWEELKIGSFICQGQKAIAEVVGLKHIEKKEIKKTETFYPLNRTQLRISKYRILYFLICLSKTKNIKKYFFSEHFGAQSINPVLTFWS